MEGKKDITDEAIKAYVALYKNPDARRIFNEIDFGGI